MGSILPGLPRTQPKQYPAPVRCWASFDPRKKPAVIAAKWETLDRPAHSPDIDSQSCAAFGGMRL